MLRSEVFAQVIQKNFTSTQVRLFTKLKNFVQGMQILILSPHGAVLICDYEVFEPFPVRVAIV